jgi:hypothetical protein
VISEDGNGTLWRVSYSNTAVLAVRLSGILPATGQQAGSLLESSGSPRRIRPLADKMPELRTTLSNVCLMFFSSLLHAYTSRMTLPMNEDWVRSN